MPLPRGSTGSRKGQHAGDRQGLAPCRAHSDALVLRAGLVSGILLLLLLLLLLLQQLLLLLLLLHSPPKPPPPPLLLLPLPLVECSLSICERSAVSSER